MINVIVSLRSTPTFAHFSQYMSFPQYKSHTTIVNFYFNKKKKKKKKLTTLHLLFDTLYVTKMWVKLCSNEYYVGIFMCGLT